MEVSILVILEYCEINIIFVYILYVYMYIFIFFEFFYKIIIIILNLLYYYEFNEKIWYELIFKNYFKFILLNFIVL